jgi:hypothetical protein
MKYSDYLSSEGLDLIFTWKKTGDDVLLIDPMWRSGKDKNETLSY